VHLSMDHFDKIGLAGIEIHFTLPSRSQNTASNFERVMAARLTKYKIGARRKFADRMVIDLNLERRGWDYSFGSN
jgi:hypothetical protein